MRLRVGPDPVGLGRGPPARIRDASRLGLVDEPDRLLVGGGDQAGDALARARSYGSVFGAGGGRGRRRAQGRPSRRLSRASRRSRSSVSTCVGDRAQVVADLIGVVAASYGRELTASDLLGARQERQIEVGRGSWGSLPRSLEVPRHLPVPPARMQRPSGDGRAARSSGRRRAGRLRRLRSRRSTSSNDAIATSIWSASGCWVVIFCSQMPGRHQRPHHAASRGTARRAAAPRRRCPAISGIATIRDAIRHQKPGVPEQREHEDRDDHHDDQEVRAAADVLLRVPVDARRARAARRARRRRSSCARRRGTRTPGGCPSCDRSATGSPTKSATRNTPSSDVQRRHAADPTCPRPRRTGRSARG